MADGACDCEDCRLQATIRSTRLGRSPLGWAYLYRKPKSVQQLAEGLRYDIDETRLCTHLRGRFVRLGVDDRTRLFLAEAERKSWSICAHYACSAVKLCCGSFMSVTSINGLLGRGSMLVLTTAHVRSLLRLANDAPPLGRCLDVGAGDGHVTDELKPLFRKIVCTEASGFMAWRLRQGGYECHRVLDVSDPAITGQFDVVCCLNVLDRCDSPSDLLVKMRARLVPETGRILLAVVLPFRPFVESGGRQLPPSERVTVTGRRWEEWCCSLSMGLFERAGLAVEVMARVPYLCEGDLFQPYYKLEDAVFVLRAIA